MYKIKEKPEDFVVKEASNVKIGEKGKYTYFLLSKKEYTTEKAIQTIANYLHIPRKMFGYAGNKDKTAVTEQLCSVLGGIRNIKLKDINVDVIGKGDKPISLGDLTGNEFKIIARECSNAPKKIKKIINYFDEQRFSKNNVEVGKNIIKKDFKKAIEILIKNEDSCSEKIREYLKEMLNDYIGSLRLLPKKTLQIYVHAYQSHVWNETAKHFEDSRKDITIPLVGFDTEFTDKKIKGITEDILKKDNVNQRDFIIKQIPEISSAGSERKLFVDIKKLKIKKISEKTYEIRFFLPKGSYATLAIKNMFQII